MCVLYVLLCMRVFFFFLFCFRFVQKYVSGRSASVKKSGWKKFWINFGLLFYLFPPCGCTIVTIYEVLWVFWDISVGFYSFLTGTILLIDKDEELKSIKNFRKVIEFFGES